MHFLLFLLFLLHFFFFFFCYRHAPSSTYYNTSIAKVHHKPTHLDVDHQFGLLLMDYNRYVVYIYRGAFTSYTATQKGEKLLIMHASTAPFSRSNAGACGCY